MKNTLIIAWVAVLVLLLTGAGTAYSPFVIDGGIINVLNPAGHDNWIGYLLNVVFSVVFGLLMMGCGSALVFSVGIASSIVAVSQQRPAAPAVAAVAPKPAEPLPLPVRSAPNQSWWIAAGLVLLLPACGLFIGWLIASPHRVVPPNRMPERVMNHPHPEAQQGPNFMVPEPNTQGPDKPDVDLSGEAQE